MIHYAIWYGRTLDGVTRSETVAEKARKRGATVLMFEAPEDGPVEWKAIPEPGLPLGYQGVDPAG